MKQRRSDGKFGHEPILPETGAKTLLRSPTKGGFKPGHPGMGGRPKGRRNRTTAVMQAILQASAPTDESYRNPLWDGVGKPPLDDLESLQWIKLHPLANLDAILAASDKRAKFFHRILRDDQVTHNIGDIKAFEERISEARKKMNEDSEKEQQPSTVTDEQK